MAGLIQNHPSQYPNHLERLPNPRVKEIEQNPKLAGIPYQRKECQRCHIGVQGNQEQGDYRGMGCSACHAAWAPQCYGDHIKVDFSKKQEQTDWVASGNAQPPITTPGFVTAQNSYLRWEDPILGINGEGRISPLMPGCQVAYTVIARDGRVLAHNETPSNPGEADAIDTWAILKSGSNF
jgi:hypothetical protein